MPDNMRLRLWPFDNLWEERVDIVIDASITETVGMDSGNDVWNLPGEAVACIEVSTGTTTVASGTSNTRRGCPGLF